MKPFDTTDFGEYQTDKINQTLSQRNDVVSQSHLMTLIQYYESQILRLHRPNIQPYLMLNQDVYWLLWRVAVVQVCIRGFAQYFDMLSSKELKTRECLPTIFIDFEQFRTMCSADFDIRCVLKS